MVEEGKITGEEAHGYYEGFDTSFLNDYLDSEECQNWLSEPITLYDNLEDPEKLPGKENISSVYTE